MKFVAIIFLLALYPVILNAQTLPPPFLTCPSTGFQAVNNPSDFQTVNLATGTTTTVKSFPIYVNALGFNPNDNRIYGIQQGTLGLVAIGSDYSYTLVPTSGVALITSVVGDVSPAGILWCLGNKVFTVDCNPSSGANYGKVTTIGNKPAGLNITDWSFPSNDNTRIYSVASDGSFIYMNTATLAVTTVLPAATVPAASYGATYFDSNGNFYAKSNTTGVIYKFINATGITPTVITFSTSSSSSQNDGARCADAAAPVIADYGDSPDGYGTYAASGGPVHLLPVPNASLAQIYLGPAVTIDGDGNPSAAADLDADDGVSSFPVIMGGISPPPIPSYSVTISVHNATASVANLAAWIDWNNNTVFDAGERMSTTVAANFTGSKTLTWSNVMLSGPAGTAGTYARIRISTGNLANATGTVADGEVEDYYIPFAAVLPVQITSFTAAKSNGATQLSWTTASEQNNKGFAIDRSSNGSVFNQVAFVASQAPTGTSAEKLTYFYFDDKPLAGINYYRLRQINIDGKETNSPVVKIVFGRGGHVINVYPNPVKNNLAIDGLTGNESIQLYSTTGQLVREEKATDRYVTLDISSLSAGIYRLTITDNAGNRRIQKIVKQ